jgi:hypothetical protein
MKKTAALVWICGMLATAHIAASPQFETAALGTRQVASALAGKGINVSPDQVELLSEVRAKGANPQLEVISVDAWGEQRAKVRLRCKRSQECLPFYVVVNWASQQATKNAVSQWSAAVPRGSRPLTPQKEFVLVRAGEFATLVIEGEHMRMQMPVICLTNGSAGTSIRVSSTDRKRIYRAEVVGVKLLKGGM